MANVLEKLLEVLDNKTLEGFISGKTAPKIDLNTNVSVETETVKTMGWYIFIAFSGSFIIMAFLMYWAMRWAIISALRNR
ncbi:hypothetical protein VB776_06865 [Arcicella sp. DC2W]|uniref:Uncharacterized protein n=1 Tax=Arcicella gelida TaxID=2984195 RepID=A0ABU5S2A3_9BACT|nr:hypothetical protein [Arcicella sp. DC2W]MEA5402628.1 hypothetical protein [Arcicella sp. DC2W]